MAKWFDGSAHTYQCDRCGEQEVVAADDRTDRKPTKADPLNQRDHDAPVGWVIATMSFPDGREIILGPHGGNALWCKECGKDAELFAKGRQLSDIY